MRKLYYVFLKLWNILRKSMLLKVYFTLAQLVLQYGMMGCGGAYQRTFRLFNLKLIIIMFGDQAARYSFFLTFLSHISFHSSQLSASQHTPRGFHSHTGSRRLRSVGTHRRYSHTNMYNRALSVSCNIVWIIKKFTRARLIAKIHALITALKHLLKILDLVTYFSNVKDFKQISGTSLNFSPNGNLIII